MSIWLKYTDLNRKLVLKIGENLPKYNQFCVRDSSVHITFKFLTRDNIQDVLFEQLKQLNVDNLSSGKKAKM